jgi:Stress responsive A/B Barrel Domain
VISATGVKHVARFWLRRPDDRGEVERCIAQLATIQHVVDTVVGPPLDSNWGRRIDKSYDLAFVMTFRTLGDCRAYFEDELHQRMIGEIEPLVDRVEAFYLQY